MVNTEIDGDETMSGQSVPGGQRAAGQSAHSEPTASGFGTTGETSLGLEENVAGALAYLLGILTGVLFFVLESDNKFVRFHAAQSMVVFGGALVAYIALSVVSGIVTALTFGGGLGSFLVGGLLSLVLTLVWLAVVLTSFGLWLYLMYKAFQGETPRIPIAAGIADNLVN
ncbi:MAG: DUF4870 domain-containing protein [Halorientalis sp.]